MSVTTDRNDPDLGYGVDGEPREQQKKYLVLPEEVRAKGFVRPLRRSYIHAKELGGCGTVTTMASAIAETYASNPGYYGATYCCGCRMHKAVGENGEFFWINEQGQDTTEKVGT